MTTKPEQIKTIPASKVANEYPYAVVRVVDGEYFCVSCTHTTFDLAMKCCANLCEAMGYTYEVRKIDAATDQELEDRAYDLEEQVARLSTRIAELEDEKARLVNTLSLMAETLRTPKPVSILDGGPEVSDHLKARIKNFEGGLRHLCHQAYALQFELADEGHVCHVDGKECWGYGSKRMKNVSDELEGMIKHYFGGFNYPTD